MDTLAGGGAAEGGDSLRFTATAAGHGQKTYPVKQKERRMRTALFHKDDVFIIACCGMRSGRYYAYPYRIFPADLPYFSPELRSHRLVSPIRLSVLGRTYGTYLHYERSYSINVFFIRRFGQPRLRFDLRAKNVRFPGNFPAIPGKFPRDSGEISPDIPGKFPGVFSRGK